MGTVTYQNHRQVMTHSNMQSESRVVVMTSFISTVASIELEGTSVELVLKGVLSYESVDLSS